MEPIVIPKLRVLAKDNWKEGKSRPCHFVIELVDCYGKILFGTKTTMFPSCKTLIGNVTLSKSYQKTTSDGYQLYGDFKIDFYPSSMAEFAHDMLKVLFDDINAEKTDKNINSIISLFTKKEFGKVDDITTLVIKFASLEEWQIVEDYYQCLYDGIYEGHFISSLED